MFTHRFEERVRRISRRIGAFIAKSGLSANAATVIGFLLNFPAAFVLAQGQFWSWIVGAGLVLFAGAFDMLDGAIAKATNKTTRFGAFLDSSFDRYSEVVVFFGLLLYFLLNPTPYLVAGVILVFVSITGSLLVSYVKARAESLDVQNTKVGLLQRPERVLLVATGCVINAWWDMAVIVVLAILAIGTHYTAFQRIGHVWFETRRQETLDKAAQELASVASVSTAVVTKEASPAKEAVKDNASPEEEPTKRWSFRRASGR